MLTLVHGVDPRNHDPAMRMSSMQEISSELKLVSQQQNNRRLILLGDFNMNPYDMGMNLPAGLNAMMTRVCTERGYRTHNEMKYDFYYNPMWSLFGDNTKGPAGTVHDTSSQGPYGWSMFDQVIMHHSVIDLFEEVSILTNAGAASLASSKGRPDALNASDHFPILVRFQEK